MAVHELWLFCSVMVTVRSIATQCNCTVKITLLFRRRRNIQFVSVVGWGPTPYYDCQTAKQSKQNQLFFYVLLKVFYVQEFMLATNMSDTTSAEEKLRWAFKMYDQDSSGMDGFFLSGNALYFPLL